MPTSNNTRNGQAAPDGDLIAELAANTSDAAQAQREATRLMIRAKVMVDKGSMSARDGTTLQGITGDISTGGTQLLLTKPLNIGDVYHLSFDRTEVDIPPVYALCLRGRQVRPDAFEAGLRFLEPVRLPASAEAPSQDLL